MGTTGQSITLANSIIGVGILAMPFCFQQCGVLLATLILLFMGLVSRLCCYFLLKSALIARRRNFEFLAFHVFGPSGKWAVEVGIIGFLMGTCIAYFVVVGDLGPQIIAKMFNINQSDILRTSIMVIVSLVCVLPLGLLRNVDSLSNVSAATIGFYFCLVMKVIAEAASQLLTGEWQTRMEMWKPSGVLQCVPIFSMALFCQTQLFEIFESLPSLSLEKMNVVTKNAINICTGVYFTLGLFGYIAFCSQNISGNILMSLSPTMASDVIKLGFVMSLAFSFPLIIFPCRASLYSFLYRKAHPSHHDHIINHSIPESTFRCITVSIIAVALFISLLIPNIELVLGLVGSTIGVLVCVVFPAACFINLTFKDTNERVLAKAVLILGLVILVLGTFANLQAAEYKVDRHDDKFTQERIDKIVEDFFESKKSEKSKGIFKPLTKFDLSQENAPKVSKEIKDSEVQPPNPVPPESQSNEKNSKAEIKKVKDTEKNIQVVPEVVKDKEKVPESHPKDLKPKLDETKLSNGASKKEISKVEKTKEVKPSPNQEKIDMMKQQQLIETIKQHGEEQKELIKEQKEILDEIIKTKNELKQNKKEVDSSEAKKIAVESIQKIANMAIKSLGGVSEKPLDQINNDDKKSEPLENIANKAVQEIAKKAVETIEAIKEINEKPKDQLSQNEINPDTAGGNKDGVSNNVINSAPVQNIQNNVQPTSVNANSQTNNHNSDNLNLVPVVKNNDAPVADQPNNIIQPDRSNSEPIVNIMQPVIKQDTNAAQAIPNNSAANQVIPDQINQNKLSLNQENQNLPKQSQKLPVQSQNSLVQNQNVPLQNQNINKSPNKEHSHSPDEPQSYKLGEDSQKNNPVPSPQNKDINQNVPLPLAMNHVSAGIKADSQIEKDVKAENTKLIDNALNNGDNKQNNLNKVQNNGAADASINNNVKSNIENIINPVPVRQKREVVDCAKKTSLKPKDKEICETLVSAEYKKSSQEILPLKFDLNEIALPKSLPIDINLIHHIRSLKSYDETDRER